MKSTKAKIQFARMLRKNLTFSERKLWNRIRRKACGYGVKRQVVIRGWIVDFYCPAAKLAIEVDGGYHDHRKAEDAFRDRVLAEKCGITTLRFTNEEVGKDGGIMAAAVVSDTMSICVDRRRAGWASKKRSDGKP